jgi:hypothetical protein
VRLTALISSSCPSTTLILIALALQPVTHLTLSSRSFPLLAPGPFSCKIPFRCILQRERESHIALLSAGFFFPSQRKRTRRDNLKQRTPLRLARSKNSWQSARQNHQPETETTGPLNHSGTSESRSRRLDYLSLQYPTLTERRSSELP